MIAPGRDSETSTGPVQSELARLSNDDGEGEAAENPASAQAAPTSRALRRVAAAAGVAGTVPGSDPADNPPPDARPVGLRIPAGVRDRVVPQAD